MKKQKLIKVTYPILVVVNIVLVTLLLTISPAGLIFGQDNSGERKAEKINRLDINKDGVVDITDLIALKRHLLVATTGDTENEWYIADQEIDGTIIPISNIEPVTEKTTCTDAYGNKYVIPKGFGLAADSGETVPEGIVIEDATHPDTVGSQFVWIPVGKVYTDVARTEENAKDITLGRYTFASDGTPTLKQNADNYLQVVTIKSNQGSNHQELANSGYGNTIARSLGLFIQSVKMNGGYYIARFEASKNEQTAVSKKDKDVWRFITQPNAATASRNMYSQDITSDLMNSYAWDTTIVYIQNCGRKLNSSNYSQADGTTPGEVLSKTGNNRLEATGFVDEQCNIYDMATGVREWTTETEILGSEIYSPCTNVGGGYWGHSTDYRFAYSKTEYNYIIGFRPILYFY